MFILILEHKAISFMIFTLLKIETISVDAEKAFVQKKKKRKRKETLK